jgi:hypothetical protein
MEILVMSAVSIVALAFGVFRYLTDPVSSVMIVAFAFVVGVVAMVVGLSQLWAFIRGEMYAVDVTDAGIFANGEHWPWERVIAIRGTLSRKTEYAAMNIRVSRQGLNALSLPVEISGGQAEVALDALRKFLDTQPHIVQLALRVY